MSGSAAGSGAVVGGGVFGVTAASELRRRGHRVTLADAGDVPHPDASSTRPRPDAARFAWRRPGERAQEQARPRAE